MFVQMNKGPAESDQYSAYIHDNQFFSNDLFLNSYTEINMDIKMVRNSFNLLKEPFATERENRMRAVGAAYEAEVRKANEIHE